MSENLQVQTCERIFRILQIGVPKLFEAENFVESENRISPYQVFIESRDVLSHLRDIANNSNSKDNIDKNIVEIEEHLRRGIVETYQEHYEFLSSNVFRSYGKYKKSYAKFEGLLGLRKIHLEIHYKVRKTLKEAQNSWMDGRNLKNNELDSDDFNESIKKFVEASNLVSSIDFDIDTIYNNFYKRGIISSFVFLFSVTIVILLLIKMFIV